MKNIKLLEAVDSYENIAGFLDVGAFALALLASLAAALVCIALYRAFYESRGTGSQIYKAFIHLSLAITALFLCIQVSIPLSLGLLGSLSIIRFRTPIKEPEEVGFIMLVIASSIAAATFHFAFMAVLIGLAAAASFVAAACRNSFFKKRDGIIAVTLSGAGDDTLQRLEGSLRAATKRFSVQSAAEHDGATIVQISFTGLSTDVVSLQKSIRAACPEAVGVNVFLDRPGGFR